MGMLTDRKGVSGQTNRQTDVNKQANLKTDLKIEKCTKRQKANGRRINKQTDEQTIA